MSYQQEENGHGLPPWPQLSFVLSKEIIKNDLHSTFLTSTESQHFESAVETYSQWSAFINATHENLRSYPVSERAIAAMRVRAMLAEQFIPHVYHSNHPCCQHAQLDLDRICQETRSLQLPDNIISDSPVAVAAAAKPQQDVSPPGQEAPQLQQQDTSLTATPADASSPSAPLVPIKKEENNMNAAPDVQLQPPAPSSVSSSSKENEDLATKTDAIAPTYSANIPLLDVYHTLDQDYAAMIELQKLEESEAQEELNEEEDKDQVEEHSLSILNTAGNFNLKYLLQGIAANRQKTTLSDRDIRNLLSDFKPHRTKWASDDKIGQEELYEACEKVLTDLKNFTEHSTPFLNKVSKREAPDYFDVIKRPMDLGTVTKKMKALQYKSKKEFSDDLYLIYENCLLYNTNPASEYRKHAVAMRRKTDRLMAKVPDVTVKDRVEAETEEFGDEASEDGDSDIQRVSRKAPGSHKHSAASRAKDGELPRGSRERSLTRESSAAPSTSDIFDNDSSMTPNGHAPHKAYGGKQVRGQGGDVDPEEEKVVDVELAEFSELQDQIWHDLTKKSRARMASDIEKQYQFPFGDRAAITRSSLEMERFAMMEHMHRKPETVQKLIKCPSDRFTKWAERNGPAISLYDDVEFDSSDDENLDVFFSRKIAKPTKTEQDDAMRSDLFLPEYMLMSGIPEIYSMRDEILDVNHDPGQVVRRGSIDTTFETVQTKQYTDVPLDVYPSVRFPNHGLGSMIDKNLRQLQKVRVVYAKCNAIRNNIPISALASSISLADPLIDASNNAIIPLPPKNKPLPPLIIDQNSGLQLLQRTLSKLLGHAGFEGAQTSALNVLTELAIDYMLNVGRTIRSYWDDYGRQMSNEEILMHVLYENGVSDISELESYIRDDVERYGHRLDELHRRLESSYQDILTGPVEKSDDEGFLQDEETFVTGLFGEDFGEDYFGFKELGLDRELNIDAFSIPPRLWFGGNKEKAQSSKSSSKEPVLKYPPPPPFSAITSEKQLIGLLQPVFQKKLSESTGSLVEDEYVPNRHRNRPRYPPTNKTMSNRKKPLKDSGINSASSGAAGAGGENRKTKRKRPPEEIMAIKAERAEKKRQKLEEKAQRTAEKEQKRKLREELKEQERLAKQEAKEKKVKVR
ncbi:hypothetical protein BDB00DRAFT_807985 [Zychaea mexicana]|uniref:uncharacterized protein n=1 Tax=Zychaea mexicana TaxID=64656 RepID=UPI0022FF39EB|nr:uncharacterized protein BDB00DRAFT_807985 [Zychaea mexicana]KAI9496603.1 hypothetical protein BDB00DRAFT_807985 [Zychaea mexicana]